MSATSLWSKIGITRRTTRIYWTSTRTNSSGRRIIYEGKGSSRCSNPKYARTGKLKKNSRTTSWWSLSAKVKRKSWNKQKLTSQWQEMQDQMNSMNVPGEFQEVEPNYSRRLSYVPSRPAMIPHGEPRQTPASWDMEDILVAPNIFGNQFSTFDSPRDRPQGVHCCKTQREQGPVPQAAGTGTPCSQEETKNRGTIPKPTFAGKPSTVSSLIPVEFPHNSMVGQQISVLQSDKLPHPQSFLFWKNTSQKSSDYLFWFFIGSNVLDQRSGDGWFIRRIAVVAIRFWNDFS